MVSLQEPLCEHVALINFTIPIRCDLIGSGRKLAASCLWRRRMALVAIKKTPGQREQRFCSSSQVIRDGFYILPPGICIINYYYHGKVGLRPPTRDWESSNCHGPPHVPGACSSCMHLAGLDITMTARSRPPPVLLWRREVGRPLPASSGGGE